jgi:spore maturation protein A
MNYIWFCIILASIICAAFTGKAADVVNAVMAGAQKSVEVALYLAGVMAFWLGIMKIAEKSGFVNLIAKALTPVAGKLFNVPAGNPAVGDIAMNFASNAFGLSNAATPIGIKAMNELQKLNKDKNSASNDMCTLLAMNTAGFQVVPATVIAVLAAFGSKNPAQIIVPTLIVTSFTFVFALVVVKILEKLTPPQSEEENDKNCCRDAVRVAYTFANPDNFDLRDCKKNTGV